VCISAFGCIGGSLASCSSDRPESVRSVGLRNRGVREEALPAPLGALQGSDSKPSTQAFMSPKGTRKP
jgi:hypothetical protein